MEFHWNQHSNGSNCVYCKLLLDCNLTSSWLQPAETHDNLQRTCLVDCIMSQVQSVIIIIVVVIITFTINNDDQQPYREKHHHFSCRCCCC